MSGSRVPLAKFTNVTAKTTRALNVLASNFQFKRTIEQSLFTAVVSSPFAIGFGDDARLAIWQENPELALVNASHKFVIMIDPGHGGTDPGSVGHNGLQEKTLTLDIAKRAF